MQPRHLIYLFVIALAWLATASAQETFTLVHKLEKGKTYHYASTSASKMTQEMGGQEMHISMDARIVPSVTVEKVTPEGNIVMVYSADSAQTHVKAPNMDSTMVLSSLVGKRTRLTVSPTGEVISRETIDTIKVDRMMGGAGVRDVVRFPRLAAGPVKMGDKWDVTQGDTTELGAGKIVTTTKTAYTLAGKEKVQGHDCLKVTFAGTATVAGKGTMMGLELFVEGSGKTSGTLYFDAQKGLFVRNEAKVENETTMAATGQQNMTIPISSTTETVFSLKE
jgi:hypothetical protein